MPEVVDQEPLTGSLIMGCILLTSQAHARAKADAQQLLDTQTHNMVPIEGKS